MKRVKQLDKWNMSMVDGGTLLDRRKMPQPTKENMEKLVGRINHLSAIVTKLIEMNNTIEFEDD